MMGSVTLFAPDALDAQMRRLGKLVAREMLPELQSTLRTTIDGLPSVSPTSEQYVTLLRLAERSCIEPALIDQLLVVSEKAALCSGGLSTARWAVGRRQLVRRVIQSRIADGVALVSLGLNCCPWNLLTRWGLIKASEYSALFSPFALSSHKMNGVIDALSVDFLGYSDVSEIQSVETEGGHLIPTRMDRSAVWNHNKGNYWLDDEFAALRRNLAWKIANMRSACRAPHPVFIMTRIPSGSVETVARLAKSVNIALERHTGSATNRLIMITHSVPRRSRRWIDDNTLLLSCPFPEKGYVWHLDANSDTSRGLSFERDFIAKVYRGLAQWGLAARS